MNSIVLLPAGLLLLFVVLYLYRYFLTKEKLYLFFVIPGFSSIIVFIWNSIALRYPALSELHFDHSGVLVIWSSYFFALLSILTRRKMSWRYVILYLLFVVVSFILFAAVIPSEFVNEFRGIASLVFILFVPIWLLLLYFSRLRSGFLYFFLGYLSLLAVSFFFITVDIFQYFSFIAAGYAVLYLGLLMFSVNVPDKSGMNIFGLQRDRFVSITTRIVISFLALTLLVGLVVASVLLILLRDASRNVVTGDLSNRAFYIASSTSEFFTDVESFIAQEYVRGGFDPSVLDVSMQRLQEELRYVDALFVLTKDNQIVDFRGEDVSSGVLASSYIQKSDTFFYSPVFVDGEDVFVYVKFVSQDIRASDVVLKVILSPFYKDLLENFRVLDGFHIYFATSVSKFFVLTADGVIEDTSIDVLERPLSDTCYDSFQGGMPSYDDIFASDYEEYRGRLGGAVFGASHGVSGVPLCLIYEADIDQIQLTSSSSALVASVVIFGLSIVIFSSASYYTARSIAKPVNQLRKGVEVVRSGNLKHKVGTDLHDEIGELSRAFDDMTEELRESSENIEQKVSEQTEEIRSKNLVLEEQKRQLSLEKEKMEAMISSLGEGFIFLDTEGRIVLFNRAIEKMSGHSNSSVVGKKLDSVLVFIDADPDPVLPASSDDYSEPIARESVLQSRHGRKIPVAVSVFPVQIQDGFVGSVVIVRNVAREKEIETMKTNFVSIVSHQLRTPLSAVNWILEMLVHGDFGSLTDEQLEQLNSARDSNQRMTSLINDLLRVSKIKTKAIQNKPQEVDLEEAIQSIVDEYEFQLKASSASISVKNIPKELQSVVIDPGLFSTILDTLVSNAIDYSRPGVSNEIVISVNLADNFFVVSVADKGVGIPEKDQAHIFDIFYRGSDASTFRPDGSGLGLHIVSLIVDYLGGRIWFESEYGEGSTFHVELPFDA